MLKRTLSLFLSIVMIFSLVPFQAFATEETLESNETVLVTEPVETEAPETEPVVTESEETEAAETEVVVTEPAETEALETEPAETEALETEAVETEPVQTEPAEMEPVETEPAEGAAAETEEPAESEPEEIEETEPEISGISDTPRRTDWTRQEGPDSYTVRRPETITKTVDVRNFYEYENGHFRFEDTTETTEKTIWVEEEVFLKPMISTFSIREESWDRYTDIYFTTFADLKELAQRSYDDYTSVYYEGEDPLVISEDLVLPSNMNLHFYNENSALIIAEDVTLESYGSLHVDELVIKGVFKSYYYFSVEEQLTIDGTLMLYDNAQLEGNAGFSCNGKLICNDEWISLYRYETVESIENVNEWAAIAAADDSGLEYEIRLEMTGDVTLKDTLVIPRNMSLNIANAWIYDEETYNSYQADCTFIIAESGKLVLNGDPRNSYQYLYADVLVQGTLENNSDLNLYSYDGVHTLTFTDTATYKGNGYISGGSYDLSLSWSDYVIGLDFENFEITENYHEEDDGSIWYNWELRDVSGLIRLAAPKNPTWHKDIIYTYEWDEKTEQWLPSKSQTETVMGAIAWQPVDPHQGQFKIYVNGVDAEGNRTTSTDWWNFEVRPGVTKWYSVDSFIMDDPETGTYTFNVQAMADGTEYYHSVLSETSAVFEYTKPSKKLGKPKNLHWGDGLQAHWEHASGLKDGSTYEVQFLFARTQEEEPRQVGSSWGSHWEEGYWTPWDGMIQENGPGYYYFRVRAISNDITAKCNGDWTELSEPYYMNQTVENVKDNLKDISTKDSDEEIRDQVQSLDTEELKNAMLADNGTEGVMDRLEKLEDAVGGAAGVQVNEEVAAFDADKVSIVGANLNNAAEQDQDITLVLDKPKEEHVLEAQYDNAVAVSFSMTLDNVEDTQNLAVPVKVTLPVPAGINPDFLVILHYQQDGGMDVIDWTDRHVFKENGVTYVSFVLTSFSDFVITHLAELEEDGGNINEVAWEVTSWGNLKITGEGAMADFDAANDAPWAYLADQITGIEIGEGITHIGANAFSSCDKVTEVTVPANVMSIGLAAFNSEKLTAIHVAQENAYYKDVDGVLYTGNGAALLSYPIGRKDSEYTIPASVQQICNQAFTGAGLEKIWFEGNAPEIDWWAFTDVYATVYYPANNDTWTEDVMQNYGGELTWCKASYVEVSGETSVISGKSVKLTAQILPENEAGNTISWALAEESKEFATLKVSKGVATVTAKDVSEVRPVIVLATSAENVAPAEFVLFIRPKVKEIQIGRMLVEEDGNETHEMLVKPVVIEVTEEKMNGFQVQLDAEAEPLGADKTVTWSLSSSPKKIATIDKNTGLVSFTGKTGKVTVTATAADGSKKKATATFVIAEETQAAIQGMEAYATEENPYILAGGDSLTLKVVNTLKDDKTISAKNIKWTVKAIDDTDEDAVAAYVSIKSGKLTTKNVLKETKLYVSGEVSHDGNFYGVEHVGFYLTIQPVVTQVKLTVNDADFEGTTYLYDWNDPELQDGLKLGTVLYPMDIEDVDVEWSALNSKKKAEKQSKYATWEETEDGELVIYSDSSMSAGTVTFKATAKDRGKQSASVQVKFGAFADEVKIGMYDMDSQFTEFDQFMMEYNKYVYLYSYVFAADGTGNVSQPGVTWSLKDAADKNFVTLKTQKDGSVKVTAKEAYKVEDVVLVATSKDGMASDEITITILPKDPEQINIWAVYLYDIDNYLKNVTKDTLRLNLNLGMDEVKLRATDLGMTALDDVQWSAKVDKKLKKYVTVTDHEDGTLNVKMTQPGTVTVTAKSGKKSATVTIQATKLAREVEIYDNATKATENLRVASGKSLTLKANVPNASNSKVTWSVAEEDAQYATISSSGKLTATKNLTAQRTITVTAVAQDGGGAEDTIDVTIYPLAQGVQIYSEDNAINMRSISILERIRSNTTFEWDMAQQGTISLASFVYPYYGDGDGFNAMQDVTWKSSSTKIAKIIVDENGNPVVDENGRIQIQCLKPGTVTITATAKDGSGKKVSVKIKIVRQIKELIVAQAEGEYLEIVGGSKATDLSKLVTIDPADATNKKLSWSINRELSRDRVFGVVTSAGKLTTLKVTAEKEICIEIKTNDGSNLTEYLYVRILPKK